jgi:hypothetical protein
MPQVIDLPKQINQENQGNGLSACQIHAKKLGSRNWRGVKRIAKQLLEPNRTFQSILHKRRPIPGAPANTNKVPNRAYASHGG